MKVCFYHYSVVKALGRGRFRSCLPARRCNCFRKSIEPRGIPVLVWSLLVCYPVRSASVPHQEFQLYAIGFLCQDPVQTKFAAPLVEAAIPRTTCLRFYWCSACFSGDTRIGSTVEEYTGCPASCQGLFGNWSKLVRAYPAALSAASR